MKRPFWQTLAWRFMLAFVLVSAVTLGTVGFISAASTRSQFSALLGEQARENIAGQVQTYVEKSGTLMGFVPTSPDNKGGFNGPPPRGLPAWTADFVVPGWSWTYSAVPCSPRVTCRRGIKWLGDQKHPSR